MKSLFALLAIVILPSILPSKKDMSAVNDKFFFDKREVTNQAWKNFENYLTTQGKELSDYRVNEVWGNEPLNKTYYSHAAYEDYPVVGITQEGAKSYCQWRNVQSEVNGTYRLPTKTEFLFASAEGENNAKWAKTKAKALKKYGDKEAFYNFAKENPIGNFHLTAPVSSYLPNGFGLYNLKGNVAELVADEAIALGGSWKHTTEEELAFTQPEAWIGFRCVCELE